MLITLLLTVFIIICVLLIILVLLQKGRGGGLGAVFGGMGTSAFGTKTGDVLTWATIVLTTLFLVLAVVTAMVIRPAPTMAAAPTFDPLPTDIQTPIKVRISSTTPDAKVYYTTDGQTPDQTCDLYAREPVTVAPRETLKAIAYGPSRSVQPSSVTVGYYGPSPTTQPATQAELTAPPDQTQPAHVPPLDQPALPAPTSEPATAP